MSYCPNCNTEVQGNATSCAVCNAHITGDAWKPTATPTRTMDPPNPATKYLLIGGMVVAIALLVGAIKIVQVALSVFGAH
ncbi:MAG TPA: hypothetical protein PKN64_10315 [Casimicrobium sp.]|nr:hypothetical protein [Casimicrobium sp.]